MSASRENSIENKYLYNNKELQTDFDINWYDYGARMYQADLGGFFTFDPLAAKYQNMSPYGYAADNPIKFIDYNGAGPIDPRTFKRPSVGIKFKILGLYGKSQASTAYDRRLWVASRVMAMGDGETPQSYENLKIKEGSEFIDRQGTDMTHMLESSGGVQTVATEIASTEGNYDIQIFSLFSDENFVVKSVTDGIITGEMTYTKNENGEYELTKSRSFTIEYTTHEEKKRNRARKEEVYKVTDAKTTETITDHTTGEVSTVIHSVKRVKVEREKSKEKEDETNKK